MLTVTVALAAPLVHDGSDPTAAATEATGTPWEPVPWSEVRAGPARTLGGQATSACTGSGDLEAAIADLERAVLDADDVAGKAGAALAIACDANAADLARIAYLRGVAASEAGAPEASVHFARARGLDPALAWDPDFSERFRGPFDTAVPGASHTLSVLPAGTVDGSPAPAEVVEGRHLVRAGEAAVWVDSAYTDTLVVPVAFPADAIGWIAEDARRQDLSRLLAVHLGEGVEAGVFHDGRTWTGRTGRADWVAHGAPEVAPPPVAPALKRRKHPLLFVGAGLVAAGAVASGVTWARADGERYASLDGWKAGRTAYRAGYGAMGVGLALVAVDLAL